MKTPTPERIIELVASITKQDKSTISLNSRFMEDLAANSLDVVELACSVEDEFGAHLSEARIMKIRTVGDVIQAIQEQKQG